VKFNRRTLRKGAAALSSIQVASALRHPAAVGPSSGSAWSIRSPRLMPRRPARGMGPARRLTDQCQGGILDASLVAGGRFRQRLWHGFKRPQADRARPGHLHDRASQIPVSPRPAPRSPPKRDPAHRPPAATPDSITGKTASGTLPRLQHHADEANSVSAGCTSKYGKSGIHHPGLCVRHTLYYACHRAI